MSKMSLIADRYQLDSTQSLGSGAFSRVHPGVDLHTNKPIAVKVLQSCQGAKQLQTEARLLRRLKSPCELHIDLPKVLWHGVHETKEITIMQKLGACLLDLMLECGRRFSQKTVLMLMDQMYSALEAVHDEGFIHCDIKPDNLVMGVGRKENRLFLIDFGLAESYMKDGEHVELKQETGFKGNYYWVSSNVLRGLTASRRDDLEALFYVTLFLSKGELPWQVFRERKGRIHRILEMRDSMSGSVMCSGLPPAFLSVFNYIKGLEFHVKPDYDWIRSQFKSAAETLGIQYDFGYDWKEAPKEFPCDSPLHDLALLHSANSTRYSQEKHPLAVPEQPKTRQRRGSMMVYQEKSPPSHSNTPTKMMAALNSGFIKSPGERLASSIESDEGEEVPRPSLSTNDLYAKRQPMELQRQHVEEWSKRTIKGIQICVVPAGEEPISPSTPKSNTAPQLSSALRLKLRGEPE